MDWDGYVDATLEKYDRWIAEGRMIYSSKVIPVQKSFRPKQWFMPSHQVLEFLRESDSFAIAECRCRELANRCNEPREVCFYLRAFADKGVDSGLARRVSLEEAETTLRQADAGGVGARMTLYDGNCKVFPLCNCCPCCCHDLHALRERGRRNLVAHSECVAATDAGACTDCGMCVDRCPFGARSLERGSLNHDVQQCYGWGLCVTASSAGAIHMEERAR